MLFPLRQDYKLITTAGALGGSYPLELTREFWLDNIVLKITGTIATHATPTANDVWNLLKRVRMNVNDAGGNRQILNATGAALLEFHRHTVGGLDRLTNAWAPDTTGSTTTGAFSLFYPIHFRHPQMSDPFGAQTALPLPRLNTNPVLEIDIASAGATSQDVATTFTLTGNLTIEATLNRRDINLDFKAFPHFNTEFITYDQPWPNSGKQRWDIPSQGYITSILQQDQTAVATRGSVLASTSEEWALEYLSTVLRRSKPETLAAINEWTNDLYPATWKNPQGSIFWDFLTDYSGGDAFNAGSALDVNPVAAAGGRASIVGSNITGGAAVRSLFSVHKVFGDIRNLKMI